MQTSTSRKAHFCWLFWQTLLSFFVLFIGVGISQSALGQTFTYDNLTITGQTSSNASPTTTIYVGRGTLAAGQVRYQGSDLGKGNLFDQTTGSLNVVATSAVTNSPYTVSNVQLLYRVYPTGSTPLPNYSAILMTQNSGANPGTATNFSNASATANIDLLNQPSVLGGGNYTVDILFSGYYDDPDTGEPTQFLNPQNSTGIGFTANFKVISPASTPTGGTTTWQSSSSTDWSQPSNWSNGVPTATSNAIIPAKTPGSTIVYPILNDPTATYAVKNLTLQGTLNSSRALLIIQTATLNIYGDLDQVAGGLTGGTTNLSGVANPSQNATIVFAGTDQVITGRLIVSDIIIAGSGTKSVINSLNPTNILVFKPSSPTNGVIVQSASKDSGTLVPTYVFDTTYNSIIDLGSSGIISTATGEGETNVSYIKGVSRVVRNLTSNMNEPFGNIGIEMNANHDVGSGVIIFRVVGDALNGPTGTTAVPIKRQYQITGDDNSNASAYSSSAATITFHYLASTDELNGISENNLTMFRTLTGGTPYTSLDGVLDINKHTVTRANLPSLSAYTLTLGDKTNPLVPTPLPVVLAAFDVTQSGLNARVTWSTASEKNSAGFEVQVSTDGAYFRKLAFVNSRNGNSNNTQSYTYLDTEANKSGIRYYRLRQVDLDGKEDFSPVRTLSFGGVAGSLATALSAYPNPYGMSDALKLAVQTTSVGTARLRVSDLMGREVASQIFTTVNGVTEIALDKAANLSAGSYLAQVTLPSGEVKTVRIQKQ